MNRLGFGAMRITGEGIWGEPPNRDEAKAALRRAIELNVNFIDTADSYGAEVSETLIAEALYPYPDDLVIATKGGYTRPGPGRWVPDGRPEHLRAGLRRQLAPAAARRDSALPVPRSRPQGAVRGVGRGAGRAQGPGQDPPHRALEHHRRGAARAQKIVPIVSVQNHYNLGRRQSERMTHAQSEEMIDICARQGIAYFPWNPLSLGDPVRPGLRDAAAKAAAAHGATPTQVAIAWLLQRAPVMVPIPGTGRVSHLEENVQAAGLRLSAEEYRALDRASQG